MFSAQAVNLAFDAEGMFTDWLRTFQDEQFPDGSLPCHIPTYDSLFGANFASGADWDSVIFHAPYYLFKYSGNRGIVDMMWDNMNRSLAFLGHSSESCLISNGIGDWAALEMLRLIRDPLLILSAGPQGNHRHGLLPHGYADDGAHGQIERTG